MNTLDSLYPANPPASGLEKAVVSPEFRKEVKKVLGTIMLFFAVYLVLVVLAVLLAIACAWLGVIIIVTIPRIFTVMIGIGLIGLGLMVLFFLLKFIFSKKKYNTSENIEIRESEHPLLFAFVNKIAKDTSAPKPKKIFLAADANAAVFYDSSFWSMFFPVKKNLLIGLGLVNAVNISEFKAVIAHEFGHFSQRSMKLGSFVYNVNRVVYNMLFDNEGYGSALSSWAGASGYFAFFAKITVRIIEGIQWVLQKMYGLVNKNYMSLSREMEFHADAVAASVTGSEACMGALRRIDVGHSNFEAVIEKCNVWYEQKIVIQNAYECQRKVAAQFAYKNELTLDHELPVVTPEFLENQVLRRVNFHNQWASHPDHKDRMARIAELNIDAEIREDSPWLLFENPKAVQEQLTTWLYRNAKGEGEMVSYSAEEFDNKYTYEQTVFSYPPAYNGFYDGRDFSTLDVEELLGSGLNGQNGNFEEIYSVEHGRLKEQLTAKEQDVAVLAAIAKGDIDTKTFDFAGEKYDKASAEDIAEKIRAEIKTDNEKLEQLDKESVKFFYGEALSKDPAMADLYRKKLAAYFDAKRDDEKTLEQMNEIFEKVNSFRNADRLTVRDLTEWSDEYKSKYESEFKSLLTKHIEEGYFEGKKKEKETAEKFLGTQYQFHDGQTLFNNELDDLHNNILELWRRIVDKRQFQFKDVLQLQLQIAG